MSADRHGIGGKIEDAANARDDRRQMPEGRKANRGLEAVSLRRFDDQYTMLVADRDRAHIPAARDRLDARDGSRAKERQDGVPVVGRSEAELDRNRARCANRLIGQSPSPERCGRPPVQLLEDLVESPDAAEAGRRGDLCHRQSRVLDQLLGQKDPPGLGDRDRRGTKMLPEQTSELTLANSEPCRQGSRHSPRRGPPLRSAQVRGIRCWSFRARRRARATFPADSGDTGEIRPLAPPPPWERSARFLAWAWAPGKTAGNKLRSS